LASIIRNPSTRVLEDLSFDTSKCSLQGIQASQARNGYSTLCETEGDNHTVDKFYSVCHVSETAMNEFCAYQEYLEWKICDYKSFSREYPVSDFDNDYNVRDEIKRTERQDTYRKEIQKSRKTLYEMIYRYQKWEQNYRIHLWLVTILDALKETRSMLQELRKAVYVFPDKFNYAASEICDQGC